MSSRFSAGAAAFAIILAAGHALAAAEDQHFKPAGKPQKAGTAKSVASITARALRRDGGERARGRPAAQPGVTRGGTRYFGRRSQGRRRRCAR